MRVSQLAQRRVALCRARQLLAFVRAAHQPDTDVLAAIGAAVPLPSYPVAVEARRECLEQEALSDLVAMGFERSVASAALSACGGDAAEAATSLLEARPPEPAVQEGVPR